MSQVPVQPDGGLVGAIRRERWVILAALGVLTLLSWAYMYADVRRMSQGICQMCAPSSDRWTPTQAGLIFVMWGVMMVGMMTPSVAPAVTLFAGLNRQRRADRRPFVPTSAFLLGYLLAWTLFSAAATGLQYGLHRAGLLSPLMIGTSPSVGGAILIATGVFQWLPLKNRCLVRCRSPLSFFITSWREGAGGAVRMGLDHGWHCVACCWLLMLLLFVAGVMNLWWVGAITAFVLVEKVTGGNWVSRAAGVALVAWGGWMVARALGA
jgi:predicted metal-binding membrane protein